MVRDMNLRLSPVNASWSITPSVVSKVFELTGGRGKEISFLTRKIHMMKFTVKIDV